MPPKVKKSAPADPPVENLASFKERFTAPFAVYDPVQKSIVANPLHDRAAVKELSRAQGVVLSVLRQAEAQQAARTPRELLFELERALLYAAAATAVAGDAEPLGFVAGDAEAVVKVPELELRAARRSAPGKSVAAMAYVCSHGLSADALDSFLGVLQRRLDTEAQAAPNNKRSAQERGELAATARAAQELREVLADMRVGFDSLRTASDADPAGGTVPTSAQGVASISAMVAASYFRLLAWVLSAETERGALRAAAASAIPRGAPAAEGSGLPPAQDAPKTTTVSSSSVAEYDPYGGYLELRRSDPRHSWGLVVNERGEIVDVDAAVARTREGALVHTCVTKFGPLAIYKANNAPIRGAELSAAEVEQMKAKIVGSVREAFTKAAKTIRLQIQKVSMEDLTAPQERHFELLPQGGENAAGQRAELILTRPSPSVKWGLTIKADSGRLVLTDSTPSLRLSDAAKNFLFEHRGSLIISTINKMEMNSTEALASVSKILRTGTTIALELLVVPRPAEVPAAPVAAVAAAAAVAKDAVSASVDEILKRFAPADKAAAQTTEKAVVAGEGEETAAEGAEQSEVRELPEDVAAEILGEGAEEAAEALEGAEEEEEAAMEAEEAAEALEESEAVEETYDQDAAEGEEVEGELQGLGNSEELITDEGLAAVGDDATDILNLLGGKAAAAAAGAAAAAPALSAAEREREAAELEAKATPKRKRRTKAEIQREKAEKKRAALAKKREAAAQKKAAKQKAKEEAEKAAAAEGTAATGTEEAPLVASSKSTASAALAAAAPTPAVPAEAKPSLYELVEAPPLECVPGGVTISKFNGEVLEFERPNTNVPWNLRIGSDPKSDEIFLNGLSEAAKVNKAHPIARALHLAENGAMDPKVSLQITACNGRPLQSVTDFKSQLPKWKSLKKLQFLVKVIRK